MDELKNQELEQNSENENIDISEEEIIVNEDIVFNQDEEQNDFEVPAESSVSPDYIKPAKKIDIINRPIQIAIVIFVAAIVVMGALFLITRKEPSNDSIVGTWTYQTTASQDEANKESNTISGVYNFKDDENEEGNYTLEYIIGNLKFTGTWYYIDDEGSKSDERTDKIWFSINSSLQGNYLYSVEDGADERILSLTLYTSGGTAQSESEKPVIMVSTDAPDFQVEADKDFKPNDGITGKWKGEITQQDYTGNIYSKTIIINFGKDGLCNYDVDGTVYTEGKYKIEKDSKSTSKKEKGTIYISYYLESSKELSTEDIKYIIEKDTKGSKLTLNGIEYEKIK